jgi:hypothetical protein
MIAVTTDLVSSARICLWPVPCRCLLIDRAVIERE